jgi:hypothetical protein
MAIAQVELEEHRSPVFTIGMVVVPLLLCTVYGYFSRYFLLSVEAGVVLALITSLMLRPYTPPSLFYFFLFQWIQVFAIIIYADYKNENIESFIDTNNSGNYILMTFIHLGAMAVAAGIFQANLESFRMTILRGAARLNTRNVLIGYVLCTLFFPTLMAFTRSMSSVNQLVESLTVLRKVFLVMLIFSLFLKREWRAMIIVILFVEFMLGFVSYFSSFKDVPLFILLVYLTLNPKIKASLVLKTAPLVLALFVALVYWSYVKPDYRDYLNGGSRKQEVTVSKQEALNFLWVRAKEFDKEQMQAGMETLIDRVQAMRYFLEVSSRVPEYVAYTRGDNCTAAVKFVMVPRFISENKGILDPSTKLMHFSGKKYATAEEGTSIAMGYFTDFYVDFGLWYMILPVIILGLILGVANRFLINLRTSYNPLFVYSLVIAVFLSMGTLESDIVFVLGYIRNYAVMILLGYWVYFKWINRFISYED